MTKLNLEVQLTGVKGEINDHIEIVVSEMKKNGYENMVEEFEKDILSIKDVGEAFFQIMQWVIVK